jgi:hypothetical protein
MAGGVASAQNFYVSTLYPEEEEKQTSCICNCATHIKAFVINPDTASLVNSVCGIARCVHAVTSPFFQFLSKLALIAAATQFASALTMPFDLYQSLVDGANLIIEKGKHAKLDNALGLIGDLSQLTDGACTFASALSDLGACASVTLWAGPLSFACALVSSVFFFINGRALYYNAKLLKEVNLTAATQNSKAVLNVVKKRSYFLNRQCGVDIELFTKTVSKIPVKLGETAAAKEKLNKAYTALRRRIQFKAFSNSLAMVITAIGIIASTLFFVSIFAPLLPITITASSLLAIVFGIVIAKMAFDLYSNKRFEHQMNACARMPKPALT